MNTETFKVMADVDAGVNPLRAALQADEKYLWVGNDAPEAGDSGITVIDAAALTTAARIPTDRGHHEFVFSADDRYAFVSNRDEGSVSVIDIQKLEKIRDLSTGPLPISLAYSPLSRAVYVADAREGVISVVDSERHEILARIEARPGLGPLRFTPDGRWGMAVNSIQNAVHVLDAATNRMKQRSPLLVADAAKDPEWEHSPGVNLGLTFYLGYPLRWPDGEIFGTFCTLDEKDNPHATQFRGLILEFQQVVERDLGLIIEAHEREDLFAELQRHRDHLREMVVEQTSELKRSEAELVEAQRIAHLGSWEWDIVSGNFHWSDEVYRIFGLLPQEFGATYEAFLASVHPEDRQRGEIRPAEVVCVGMPQGFAGEREELEDGLALMIENARLKVADRHGGCAHRRAIARDGGGHETAIGFDHAFRVRPVATKSSRISRPVALS